MTTIDHRQSPQQHGFAIVSAIFLLVILVALGAFMLSISNTQQLSSAQDVQGSRAYWAAHGGIQWAVGNLKIAPATACVASTSFPLDGFSVTVKCTPNTYTEGEVSDIKTIYWVESTAKAAGNVGSTGFIERSLSTFIEF